MVPNYIIHNFPQIPQAVKTPVSAPQQRLGPRALFHPGDVHTEPLAAILLQPPADPGLPQEQCWQGQKGLLAGRLAAPPPAPLQETASQPVGLPTAPQASRNAGAGRWLTAERACAQGFGASPAATTLSTRICCPQLPEHTPQKSVNEH